MALSRVIVLPLFFFAISLHGALGDLKCEELPVEFCAFSVSSSGVRCVLEKDHNSEYACQTSDITTEGKIREWVESEECVDDCGLQRMALGLSTDGLLESSFTQELCSHKCYDNCPNVVDLYFNLAAGEGLYLPNLCKAYRTGSRRSIEEVISSAKTSITPETLGDAPVPAADYYFLSLK